MSTLSDILERTLRELQNPGSTKTAAPEPEHVRHTEKSISLYYDEGSSDKEYHVHLIKEANGQYSVVARYGRRGGTLIEAKKTDKPVIYQSALYTFNKVVREKKAKGYHE